MTNSIENILKNVIEWFVYEISHITDSKVNINISGHSRGGVSATKFAKMLK